MGRSLDCSVFSFSFSSGSLNYHVHLEKYALILPHLAYDHGLLESNCFVHGLEASFRFQNKFVEIGHIVHDQSFSFVRIWKLDTFDGARVPYKALTY